MSADPVAAGQCFVDRNVWLYAVIEDAKSATKSATARVLVAERRIVSTQVVNEVCVNLLRKAGRSEDEIRQVVQAFYAQHRVVLIDEQTMLSASELREGYSLSYWDSLIVATALESGAAILYSEDMQDGLWINARLQIINPFRVPESTGVANGA